MLVVRTVVARRAVVVATRKWALQAPQPLRSLFTATPLLARSSSKKPAVPALPTNWHDLDKPNPFLAEVADATLSHQFGEELKPEHLPPLIDSADSTIVFGGTEAGTVEEMANKNIKLYDDFIDALRTREHHEFDKAIQNESSMLGNTAGDWEELREADLRAKEKGFLEYEEDATPSIGIPSDFDITRLSVNTPNPFKKKLSCVFCAHQSRNDPHMRIHVLNVQLLQQFVNEAGRILNKKTTGNCSRHQKQIMHGIKQARFLSLIDHASNWKLDLVTDDEYELDADEKEKIRKARSALNVMQRRVSTATPPQPSSAPESKTSATATPSQRQ